MHYGQHYADNDAIGQLTDWSGSTLHATQSTAANKPAFKTNIVATRPVARFNGTTHELFTSATALGATTAVTAFAVCSISTTPATQRPLTWAGDQCYFRAVDANTTQGAHTGDIGYSVNQLAVGLASGTFYILSQTIDLALAAHESVFYINGVGGGTWPFDSNNTANFAAQVVAIGSGSGSAYWQGDVGTVLMFNTALSAANHNLVGQFLARQYGLSWTAIT